MLDDDVDAVLNDVSPVGTDSMDNTDADGESTVVVLKFRGPGVFGCWGRPALGCDAPDSVSCTCTCSIVNDKFETATIGYGCTLFLTKRL